MTPFTAMRSGELASTATVYCFQSAVSVTAFAGWLKQLAVQSPPSHHGLRCGEHGLERERVVRARRALRPERNAVERRDAGAASAPSFMPKPKPAPKPPRGRRLDAGRADVTGHRGRERAARLAGDPCSSRGVVSANEYQPAKRVSVSKSSTNASPSGSSSVLLSQMLGADEVPALPPLPLVPPLPLLARPLPLAPPLPPVAPAPLPLAPPLPRAAAGAAVAARAARRCVLGSASPEEQADASAESSENRANGQRRRADAFHVLTHVFLAKANRRSQRNESARLHVWSAD